MPIVTTDFPSAYEFVNEHEGIISSFEDISNAIKTMIKKIEKGHIIDTRNIDNSEITTKFNLIFSN